MLKSLLQLLLEAFHNSHKSVPFTGDYQAATLTYTRAGIGVQPLGSFTAPTDGLFICQIELPKTERATAFVQVDSLDSNLLLRLGLACSHTPNSQRKED